MTPQELLVKAAEDIEQHGLWKKSYWDPAGEPDTAPACVWGSMSRAATGSADYLMLAPLGRPANRASAETKRLIDQAGELLADHLSVIGVAVPADAPYGGPFTRVVTFSDDPLSDAESVVRAMRKAAES